MKLKHSILYSALALLSISCSQDENPGNLGYGTLDLQVSTNREVIPTAHSTQDVTEDFDLPDIGDFSLKLVSNTNSYSRTWERLSQFKPTAKIPVGSYTISAYYGSIDTEGFDAPYFFGENQVTVSDRESSPVDIVCSLANVKVTIEYTEAFKNYFSDWSTTIQSTGGQYIEFAKDETRAAYVKPGQIKIQTYLKKPNGSESTFEPATIPDALPRQYYKIKLDINNGSGDAQLSITFDESTETHPIKIDISDEVMDAPAPSFLPTGFQSGVTIEAREFSYAANKDVNLSITAKGGLAGCTLTTTSQSLLAQGWPREVDLLNLTDEQHNLLTRLGLVFKGFNAQGCKMGYIDFTEVFTHLQVTDESDTHSFVVSARDVAGKVSQTPITLSVKSLPITFALQAPESIYVGSSSVTLPVQFNGTDIEQITFSYLDESNTSVVVPATVISQSGESYQVKLNIQVTDKPLQVTGSYGNGNKVEHITIPVKTPPFSISAQSYDIWARRATIQLTATDPLYQEAIEKYVVLYISNNGQWSKLTASGNDEMRTLSGLTPNTQYQLRGTCNDGLSNTNYCNTYTFQTESAAMVPNGDFETLVETINVSSINQGGKWSPTIANPTYQSTCTYVIKEPSNWASVNAKTHSSSATNQMTWFVVPSTYNTTLSWSSTVPSVFFAGGGTETPSIYQNLTAQSGSNAMVVRNVAWDENGTSPENHYKTRVSDYYYSENVPEIAHRSAGKLFLGSYTYSNGTEGYNEGVNFTSRPSKLTGWYMYAPDSNDTAETGVVTVTLLNGNNVIGTGTINLGVASSYTQFDIPITYSVTNKKATSLRIMISSSNHASYSQSEETASIKTTNYIGRYESTPRGAALTIDNLTFTYE